MSKDPRNPPPIFSFTEDESIPIGVHEYLDLHLERMTDTIAFLYCKDHKENIAINQCVAVYRCEPEGLVLVEPVVEVLHQGKPFFLLEAGNTYEVRYGKYTVLSLTPAPCWELVRYLYGDGGDGGDDRELVLPAAVFEFQEYEYTVCGLNDYADLILVQNGYAIAKLYCRHVQSGIDILPTGLSVLRCGSDNRKFLVEPETTFDQHIMLQAHNTYEIRNSGRKMLTLTPRPRWRVARNQA
jgi:hypothetical protein